MLKLMPMNIYDVAAQQARMEDQAAGGGLPSRFPVFSSWRFLRRGSQRLFATDWSLPQ